MLTYLKINEYEFKFKKGLNIINIDDSIDISNIQTGNSPANNLGKTMLVGIISRIHGEAEGFLPLSSNIVKKVKENEKVIEINWTFTVKNIEHKFLYITEDDKIKYLNQQETLTSKKYRNKIRTLLNNELFLVNETHCIDTKFILKSRSQDGFNSFFVNKSATYLALMLMILLNEDEEISFDDLHNYFKEVAKRNSYRKLEQTYHGAMINKMKQNNKIKEKYKDYYKAEQEKKKLKKIEHDKLDEKLLKQLEILGLDIDLNAVKVFHEKLVNDYNSLLDDRVNELNTEIRKFTDELENDDLEQYEAFEVSMGSQIVDYIDDLNTLLVKEFISVGEEIEKVLALSNEKMEKINKDIQSVFEGQKGTYINNNFSKGRNRDNVLETLKFNINIGSGGDGDRQANYALLFANFLEYTKLNIVVLDTMKTSETKDVFEKMLYKVKSTVISKPYIVITFNKVNEEKFYICNKFKEPLLGFKF